MTMNQIRYFIEVAHCKSFSRAAQNLYISQPNLTKYIANLEKELGFKLFCRSTHQVTLTPEGSMLLKKTETSFTNLSRSIEEVRLMSHSSSRMEDITIGISTDESIPQYLSDYMCRNNLSNPDDRSPSCHFILEESSHSTLIRRLLDHTYDAILTTDRNARKLPGIEYVITNHVPLYLAYNRNHPLAVKPDLKPTDFGSEPVYFCLPDGRDSPQYILDSIFSRTGGPLNLRLMDTPNELLMNVQIGSGAALVSGLVSTANYPDVRLKSYDHDSGATQSLIWLPESGLEPVRSLIRFASLRSGQPILSHN